MDPLTRTASPGVGAQRFDDLSATARSSVWNMQRLMTFHVVRASKRVTDDHRRRGVPIRAVVGPAAVVVNPMLEVREMGRRLGTTNRAHTIARICGAPL